MELCISGWRPGLRKITLNHIFQEDFGMGLAEAKRLVDLILDGVPVTVCVPDDGDSEEAKRKLDEVGCVVDIL